MDAPEISIVMPAYNAAKFIAESIESVINQEFSSWELIVVNDGSKDNTSEIVSGFLSDKRIRLIEQPNGGVSVARNTGINAAIGNYIAFLDSDDTFLPDNLVTKFKAISADPTVDYVYSDLIVCDSEMKEMFVEKGAPAEAAKNSILTWSSENIPGMSSNVMVRHSALKTKQIYFDKNLSNCADRYYKILLASQCKGAYIPKAMVKYRNTPGSMSKKIFLLEHDELYILDRIKEKKIIAPGKARNKVFAKVYLMLSGSWYKDAGETGKAIKFTLKALLISPGTVLKKCFSILGRGTN